MPAFRNAILLAVALAVPVALTSTNLLAADKKAAQKYHDNAHNDDHEWNSQENKAYHIYAKQNHRNASDFNKLKEDDRQAYWGWRHDHSDASLKIEIR